MKDNNLTDPLHAVFGRILAIWTLINIGYHLVLPQFGIELNYNNTPFSTTLYFLFWIGIIVVYFWDVYGSWFKKAFVIWSHIYLSLGLVVLVLTLSYYISLLPALDRPLPPYPDLFYATAQYFLPKSVEILVQQLLIVVIVLVLYNKFGSLKSTVIGYTVCFGGAHFALFFLNDSTFSYPLIMTVSAFISSLVFPYLILRVKGGFIYSYLIHFVFYIILATFFHIFPPPGYLA